MKLRCSRAGRVLIVISPIVVAAALCSPGASTPAKSSSPATAPQAAGKNAAPAEAVIPQSVFLVPHNPKEGKDPFFPLSTRVYAYAVVSVPSNPPPVSVVGELKINGTSGSEDRPLVIINNVTFGVGDTNNVISGGNPVSVHCLAIDLALGTATIQVGGERRVLRFQKSDK